MNQRRPAQGTTAPIPHSPCPLLTARCGYRPPKQGELGMAGGVGVAGAAVAGSAIAIITNGSSAGGESDGRTRPVVLIRGREYPGRWSCMTFLEAVGNAPMQGGGDPGEGFDAEINPPQEYLHLGATF